MVMSYSCDQPSTSGMGDASSELEEAQVSSHRPRTPSDDSEPPSKRARSA
ncbi:HGE-14 domain protein [Anaplasma phagocytophilum str. ApNP]|uniref:HGE-14 domain protein n=1 Tax=Anaplasma phagocytophilum str. ApNP TaxID=1359153 RepID=A0A0F3NGP6_ANAPH|nr:HGE-14 domain protein [Anaplasma phagocytophilum str. ApNP]